MSCTYVILIEKVIALCYTEAKFITGVSYDEIKPFFL